MWGYTPRQLKAYLIIAERRRQAEQAAYLSLTQLAYHGDEREVSKRLQELNSGDVE